MCQMRQAIVVRGSGASGLDSGISVATRKTPSSPGRMLMQSLTRLPAVLGVGQVLKALEQPGSRTFEDRENVPRGGVGHDHVSHVNSRARWFRVGGMIRIDGSADSITCRRGYPPDITRSL
jgi:hypothetical protein